MKTCLTTALAVLLLAGASPALADDHERRATYAPVEIFTCTYNDRKSRRDLDRPIAQFRQWMADRPDAEYASVLMTPYYANDEIGFDVAWLGWWPNGTAMGATTDRWLAEGSALQAAFFDVLDCNAHSNFASMMLKAPPMERPPQNGLLMFSDCKPKDGATIEQAVTKLMEWGQYEKENGIENGIFAYFPVFGYGDPGEMFKRVEVFSNFAMLGKIWDWWGNESAYMKAEEHHGHVLHCDTPRVYTFELVIDRVSE